MSTARDVLDFKRQNSNRHNQAHELWSIDAQSSVYDATQLMEEKGIGALPVSEGASSLAGVLSERDCARATILKGLPADATTVGQIMTREVIAVESDTHTDKCMYLMSHHQIRHLPVKSGGDLIGIMSGSDVMKFIVREQHMTIESLESFIHDDEGGEG
ncbi:MAG: CBS domain-containing protein [Pseudomonadota bacterium]